ncbi:hypothetical protein CDAR_95631 [Caerostris darwini]|uniref:Uncharacterized protein n=1 Tax=Caerostris darwini TaxID=1538125 RepID=A0AAV4UPV3_9ARAC|nr:hypothetical protein CDAR_95631 [Caerostris darwini]
MSDCTISFYTKSKVTFPGCPDTLSSIASAIPGDTCSCSRPIHFLVRKSRPPTKPMNEMLSRIYYYSCNVDDPNPLSRRLEKCTQ